MWRRRKSKNKRTKVNQILSRIISNYGFILFTEDGYETPLMRDIKLIVNYSATSNRASCFDHYCVGYDDT